MGVNKLIGYTTIEVSDGVLGLKLGAYVQERICNEFGIDLEEVASLFNSKEYEADGEKFIISVPKNQIKFLAVCLHYGVNYVAKHEGRSEFPMERAYEWIDEIGLASQKAADIVTAVLLSFSNGAPVKIESGATETPKKKAPDVGEAS